MTDCIMRHHAAEVSSHIVNLLCDDWPGGKAELYGRVLFCVLAAMRAAESEITELRLQPSEN